MAVPDAGNGTAFRQVEWPTWSHFLSCTDQIAEGISPEAGSYAFRGQADSEWRLEPSLTRLAREWGFDTHTTLGIEATAREQFSSVAHLHLPAAMIPTGNNPLAWWSLMQHRNAALSLSPTHRLHGLPAELHRASLR